MVAIFLLIEAGHAPVEQLFALLALEIGVGMIQRVFQRAVSGQQRPPFFHPMPGTPGMLSLASPISPLRSGDSRRGHAKILHSFSGV